MPVPVPQAMPVRGNEDDKAKMTGIKGAVPTGASIEFGAVKQKQVDGDALQLRSRLSNSGGM